MRQLAVYLFLVLAARPMAAQTYYDQQRQNRGYKSLSEATQRAFAVPTRSEPASGYKSPAGGSSASSGAGNSSSGGSYNSSNPSPAFKTGAQQEAERQERIRGEYEAFKRQQEIAAENRRVAAEYERWNTKRHADMKEERAQFISRGMALAADNDLLAPFDIMEGLCDSFWATKSGYRALDRRPATEACALFYRDAATGSFDTLLARTGRARLMPFTAGVFIRHLYQRFPERSAEIEQEELRVLPYFFGASRPNLMPGVLCSYVAYPTPAIQNPEVPASTKKQLIERFVELTQKYPEQGLVAAGYCRQQHNPFLLRAEACADDACRAEMYWKVLRTRVAHRSRDYDAESIDEYFDVTKSDPAASRQLGKALYWLSRNRGAELEALSTEDWREICRAQALSPYQVSTLTRDEDFPMALQYPKLNKAIKNWDKHRGGNYQERYVR